MDIVEIPVNGYFLLGLLTHQFSFFPLKE